MSEASVAAPPVVTTRARDAHENMARAGAPAWTALDAGIIALVAVLAAIPRTVNLLGLDPFVDEAAWTDWALRLFEVGDPRTWFIPLLTDGRPPLFVWTIVPFGWVVDNGILAGRLAAAFAGVLSTGALYVLGRELASRRVGAVAAILWALSPLSIFFARIAADDALLTLMAILAAWASVRLARQPTVKTGALCGLILAVTVLAKTNGAMLAIAPPLAIVLLGRPLAWRTYVRPLGAAFLAGLLASAPLFVGIVPLLRQVALHTGSANHAGQDLLASNLTVAAGWMETFVGNRFLVLAGAGIALALLFRHVGMLFVALLGGVLAIVVLEITTPLFARYLLFIAFPLFLLAAYAVDRASQLIARGAWPASSPWARVRLVAGIVVIVAGVAIILDEQADLAVAVVRNPAEALIPGSEHMGYVQNWYAVYGLGQVVDELRARSREGPLTVVVPPASRESRVLVPYAALRMYLRREPSIRIVEVPALWRAQNLRELRRAARDGPTYLIVNGSHTPGSGMPNEIPDYTRQLERRLAQDLPDAREVLRIPRPIAPNWLSLYRLDSGD